MAYQPAMASNSLGRAWLHEFEGKMEIAGAAGVRSIEMVYKDFDHFARVFRPSL